MTAYGFASRAMAFYGTFDFSVRNVFSNVFYPVYYLLYTNLSGELSHVDGEFRILKTKFFLLSLI